jgi:acetylornithine deacetylase/succinyl-diaminopimelate desuccinylase-like protein
VIRSRWLLAAAGIGVIAIAATWGWNLWVARSMRSQVYIPGHTAPTPEVLELQKYVQIDTSNPPGNETAGARYLAGLLAKHGIESELIESAPGRGNLYARIRGKKAGGALLLLHHIDVVPAKASEWMRPPFGGVIFLDQLIGRGALDMKGIGIAELAGFVAVKDAHRVPEHDIVFLATADEETGGAMGVGWLIEHRPDVFAGVQYVLNEGGINEMSESRVRYFGVEIGTKMPVTLLLRAPKREQLQQARIALEPFITPPEPLRVLPEVRVFFKALAPRRVEQEELLRDIDATIRNGKFWLLQQGYRELLQNNLWPEAVVAEKDGWSMRVRLLDLPDESPDARIAWLTHLVAPYGVTIGEIVQKTGPTPLSPLDTPFFNLIARTLHEQYGNDVPVGPEILTTGYNDSRYLRRRGMVCYGLWTFPVDFFQTQAIHSINERVRLDWYVQGITAMRKLVTAYAFES